MKNKILKYIFSSCLFLIFSSNLFSQPVIAFQDTIYDFGKIPNSKQGLECTFQFWNDGHDSLIIDDVKTADNCAAVIWEKKPFGYKQKGFIKLLISPEKIQHIFFKAVRIHSNASKNDVWVYFKGEKVSVTADVYSGPFFQMGSLKFSSIKLDMDTIYDSEIAFDSVMVMNTGNKPVSVSLNNTNENVTALLGKEVLNPDEISYIRIAYDGLKKNIYGDFFDRISLTTNDSIIPNKSFSVKGFIREDFSLLTDNEKVNAPVAVFDKELINMGTIKQDEKISLEFSLKNEGKRDLLIRKIKPGCGCTTLTNDVEKVSPGETVKLQFIFDTKGKTGNQNKKIMIISNDPMHPIISLVVAGNVVP